jgi:hypothetical protein
VTRRLYAKLLPVLLVTLALTGCAFDPPTIERTPREIANVDSTAKSRLARRGAPTTAEPAVPGEEIQVPGEEVAALEVDLTNFKERLIGLDSDEINDLMGAPGLERAEPPALIWQYRGAACTVDIFMFDDGAGSTVDHVEVRGQGGEKADEKACFTGLLRNTAALAPTKANVPPAPAPIAGPPKPGQRAAQPARGAPQASPAAARGASRTPAPAARTSASAPASSPAAAPAAPKTGEDFEDDDTGPPSAPPSGAAAKAPPPAAAPPASPTPKSDEFEIEADPDKLGPVRNEDDPASRNEDLVE